jgi:hypothetical protein
VRCGPDADEDHEDEYDCDAIEKAIIDAQEAIEDRFRPARGRGLKH